MAMASTIRPSMGCFSASPRFPDSFLSRSLSLSYSHVHHPKLLSRGVNCLGVAESGNAAQASTATTEDDLLNWVKNDNRRMLHVVYRVGDMDRTIKN